jgi:LysM repeat protein
VKKPAQICLFAAIALAAVFVACGGDDDDNGGTGQLSDPQNVPTATYWKQAPEIILLDPNNIQPLPTDPANPGVSPSPSPEPGEPGVCGATYTVVAGDTTFGIAAKCGVSPQGILDANPEIGDGRSLSVGQVLKMPAASSQTP